MSLEKFIAESNLIEGINSVNDWDIDAHKVLLSESILTVSDIKAFVWMITPNAPLRDRLGMNVSVGGHIPPMGSPDIRDALDLLLQKINNNELTPFEAHCQYERLHPFMDGNGRSGRAIWAWHMKNIGMDPFAIPFLQAFYYQTLSNKKV